MDTKNPFLLTDGFFPPFDLHVLFIKQNISAKYSPRRRQARGTQLARIYGNPSARQNLVLVTVRSKLSKKEKKLTRSILKSQKSSPKDCKH